MDVLFSITAVLGVIVMVFGSLWLLVESFKASLLWGLGYILVPFVGLIFVVTHWEEAGAPFLISLGGGVLFIGSLAFGGLGGLA